MDGWARDVGRKENKHRKELEHWDRMREKGKSVWSKTICILHYVILPLPSVNHTLFLFPLLLSNFIFWNYTQLYIKLILAPLKTISLYYQLCGDFSHFKAFCLSGLDWCRAKQLPKPPNPQVKLLRAGPGQTREADRQAAVGRWPDRLLHKLM